MAFKRSYEITPLPIGHPIYEILDEPENVIVYEILIREDNHIALLYKVFKLTEDKEIDFNELEDIKWETLEHASVRNMVVLEYSKILKELAQW